MLAREKAIASWQLPVARKNRSLAPLGMTNNLRDDNKLYFLFAF